MLSSVKRSPYSLPLAMLGRAGRNDAAVRISEADSSSSVTVLEPGLVVLRRALTDDEQRELATEAWRIGAAGANGRHSFFEEDGCTLNGPKATRGRIFDSCESPLLASLMRKLLPACERWVETACSADSSMPTHEASHLLLLYYRAGGHLGWHRDENANDGTGDEPVVNLSLGSEMDFAYRHEHTDEAKVITVCSGDVLLFGGPCRRLLHAVLDVRPPPAGGVEVLPSAAAGGRLSFTLRHAPEVIGHEHLYQLFNPQPDDARQRPTGDEQLLGATEAARRAKASVT